MPYTSEAAKGAFLAFCEFGLSLRKAVAKEGIDYSTGSYIGKQAKQHEFNYDKQNITLRAIRKDCSKTKER